MRRASPLLPAVLMAAAALAACFGPARPPMPRDEAARERRPMTLRVLDVHDAMTISDVTDPGVSHLVEVEVVAGPDDWVGRRLTLPYDEWQAGAPPPRAGATVEDVSPARWVLGGAPATRRPPEMPRRHVR